MAESDEVARLVKELLEKPIVAFPPQRHQLEASERPGVYIIRDCGGNILHVGRTVSGQGGLRQRLKNHLYRKSSFTRAYFADGENRIRDGYTYQSMEVRDDRMRALLEHSAIGLLCPAHLGLGHVK